ncbi:MAG: hypothetical protein DRJ61_05220 [Acidobacteria bacterium]|nr:MAG: hypothetical protein DRJ61_05220 [Acidobacteriota bacterium]
MKAVGSFFGMGAATGGIITGPGTTTSDSIPLMVSNKEAILNAVATKDLGAGFIHAANSGRLQKMAEGGLTALTGAKVSSPIDQLSNSIDNSNSSQAGNSTKVINVLDPSLVSDYLTTNAGEELVVNIMRRNPNAVI